MSSFWGDQPAYATASHTAWHGDIPVYTASNAYYDSDQQYEDDSTEWPLQQLQPYRPSPQPLPIQYRYRTHRRKHHRGRRPARTNQQPPTITHQEQLATYTAHHLIPALQSSSHPISVLINYGHAIVPESALAGDDNSSSIMYNAPGCTLTVVPTASPGPAPCTAESMMHEGTGGSGNSALLRACRRCGVLRVVDAWGLCRDCGVGRLLDDAGSEREGGQGGWRRR
ncbi:hypothetical protein MCOR25_007376 [Pyricularia grisea]|nr:hypothetical protein MCOR25_007376 [Pyricularia grisea]